MLTWVSRCLSAAGIRFSRHPFPPGIPPLSRSAYRHQVPDHDGVSVFRTRELRPDWAPSVPRGQRCSTRAGKNPRPAGRRITAAKALHPRPSREGRGHRQPRTPAHAPPAIQAE